VHPLRILELIILAALAAVVLFQLYAVLGRRVGRGADETPLAPTPPIDTQRLPAPTLEAAPAGTGIPGSTWRPSCKARVRPIR